MNDLGHAVAQSTIVVEGDWIAETSNGQVVSHESVVVTEVGPARMDQVRERILCTCKCLPHKVAVQHRAQHPPLPRKCRHAEQVHWFRSGFDKGLVIVATAAAANGICGCDFGLEAFVNTVELVVS